MTCIILTQNKKDQLVVLIRTRLYFLFFIQLIYFLHLLSSTSFSFCSNFSFFSSICSVFNLSFSSHFISERPMNYFLTVLVRVMEICNRFCVLLNLSVDQSAPNQNMAIGVFLANHMIAQNLAISLPPPVFLRSLSLVVLVEFTELY